MEKSVTQKHNYGCGAACLAFLMNAPYKEVVSRLGEKKARQRGYYCRELVNFLKKSGLSYEYKYLEPRLRRKIYQEGAIIYTRKSKRYPAGHYLVRHQALWMDPWINFLNNQQISKAESGFRHRLPGKPVYAIFPL